MSGIYWLASYPKSGNTWFRAFLKNLLDEGSEPVDINALNTGGIASSRDWIDEVLGFDSAELTHSEVERLRPAVYRWSLREPDIGYRKIHDAYTYLADGEPLVSRQGTRGALYILRNPLDVAPSLANHMNCTIDEAITRMGNSSFTLAKEKNGLAEQVPQRLLSWSEHVTSWLDAPGLLREVIRYEDMKSHPLKTFTQAAMFLELPTTPERIEKAVRFSDIRELQKQETEKGFRERPKRASRFFRKGAAGDWKNTLTPEQISRIIQNHFAVMRRFHYIDDHGTPTEETCPST